MWRVVKNTIFIKNKRRNRSKKLEIWAAVASRGRIPDLGLISRNLKHPIFRRTGQKFNNFPPWFYSWDNSLSRGQSPTSACGIELWINPKWIENSNHKGTCVKIDLRLRVWKLLISKGCWAPWSMFRLRAWTLFVSREPASWSIFVVRASRLK